MGCIFFAVCYLIHPFQDAGALGILNHNMAPIPAAARRVIPEEFNVLIARMLDVRFLPLCLSVFLTLISMTGGS